MTATPEARHGFFDAPNVDDVGTHRLSYLDWGDSENPNVVFCVHGLTRNAHDFDYLARALSIRHRVLALDIAGRGDSDAVTDSSFYNYVNYMHDCVSFLKHFSIDSVDWVGTSMGGIIGMMVAAFHPTCVKKLVLNDIGSFVPKESLKRIVEYVSATPEHFATRGEAEAQLRRVMASFGVTDPTHWEHFFTHNLKPHNGGWRLAYDLHILDPVRTETDNFKNINDIDLGMIWDAVKTPALLLRGELSDVLPRAVADKMKETHPALIIEEIKGVGHAPTLMEPEHILLISDWLNGKPN